MNISIAMIVKNEEKNLPKALSSIPSQYEVIVLDTGSADRTKEIARSFGANVFEMEWRNHFGDARNESISRATGDYILILDADEALHPEIDAQIREAVRSAPNCAQSVVIHNITSQGLMKHRMVRFFPNKLSFCFHGNVHEMLWEGERPAPFRASGIQIFHYGYEDDEVYRSQKQDRYISLYESHLREHPDDGYMRYQIGKLFFTLGDFTRAFEHLHACYQLQEQGHLYFPVMLVSLGYTMKELGFAEEAYNLLQAYAVHYPSFPDLPFLLGLLAMETGDVLNIPAYYQTALNIGETDKYTSVEGVGSYKAAFNLGLFYELTGKKDEAKKYYTISSQKNFHPAAERLAKL